MQAPPTRAPDSRTPCEPGERAHASPIGQGAPPRHAPCSNVRVDRSARVTMGLACALVMACADRPRALRPPPDAGRVEVVARTPEIRTYPCVERCHARRAFDPTPRALREFHTGREVRHGPAIRWCGFCHALGDLDHLRLIDGEAVGFDASHRLCGQCHGEKLRDWERGIHGSQSGSWAGVRLRRSCVTCHDPHTPRRPTFDPLPPPAHDRALSRGHP